MQSRDGCWWAAPWRALEQEWYAVSARAQQHLTKIADSVQKTTYLDGEHWGALSDCALLQERASSRLLELVHRCRKRLNDEVDALSDVVRRMRGLLYDESARANTSKKTDERLRQRYEAFLVEVVGMYERELIAKALIAADVTNCEKHDTMTLYIAAWQMQPHIDKARIDEINVLIQNDSHYC